jgi:hypothetical protein
MDSDKSIKNARFRVNSIDTKTEKISPQNTYYSPGAPRRVSKFGIAGKQ